MTTMMFPLVGKAELLYLPSRRIKKLVALYLTIAIFLLLFLLQPFGEITHGFTVKGILRIMSYAISAGFALWISELYIIKGFHSLFSGKQFYLPLLWYLFEIILATVLIFLCKNAWSEFSYLSWNELFIVMQRSFSIAVFPLSILFIFLLGQRRKSYRLRLNAQQGFEVLSVDEQQLLYLQSEDNYTRIFYLAHGRLNKKMLRGSLTSFEQQLSYPFVRCHRSYIVNLAAIEIVKGNSQGYQLVLSYGDQNLKVSRKCVKVFERAWEKYATRSKQA